MFAMLPVGALWHQADTVITRRTVGRAAGVRVIRRSIAAARDHHRTADVGKVGGVTAIPVAGGGLHGIGMSARRRPGDQDITALLYRGDNTECRGWIGRVNAREE